MLKVMTPLVPLLLAAGMLLGGNGLQATVLSLRGASEGFSTAAIGLLGTGYFAGYIIGCFVNPWLVREVGHIRVFAALAAMVAAGTLSYLLWINPWFWTTIRFVCGFCFAGLFAVMESWLNAASGNENRVRVFSIYRVVDLTCVASGQYLMPLIGVEGFLIFIAMSVLTCFSVIPVALFDRSNPAPPETFHVNPRTIWNISPIACIGCVSIGLTNTGFRLISPLHVQAMGLNLAQIATFLSLAIFGAALLQFPLGHLSDRLDRRLALMIASTGSGLAALFLAFAPESVFYAYIGSFFYGALSLPLYSLVAAHAYDRASSGQYVIVAAGLSFFFSLGAMIGPIAASLSFQVGGGMGLFCFLGAVQASLTLIAGYRLMVRPQQVTRAPSKV
ncbi:MAG TPA: MFS transporter [Aestuariivirgaceae bacterium]|jgi:MFS family permease